MRAVEKWYRSAAMAASTAAASGVDVQGDARKRPTGQANGSLIPNGVADKMDEKTKQKVGDRCPPSLVGMGMRDIG